MNTTAAPAARFTTVEITTGHAPYRASTQTANVAGHRVHNGNRQHRVQVWPGRNPLLSAQPSTIGTALGNELAAMDVTLRPGDVVEVDGKLYTVTTRVSADPELVPVA